MTEAELMRDLVVDLHKIVLETQKQVSKRAWLAQEIQSEAFAGNWLNVSGTTSLTTADSEHKSPVGRRKVLAGQRKMAILI